MEVHANFSVHKLIEINGRKFEDSNLNNLKAFLHTKFVIQLETETIPYKYLKINGLNAKSQEDKNSLSPLIFRLKTIHNRRRSQQRRRATQARRDEIQAIINLIWWAA
jgi:hypothetical protein